MNLNFPLDLSRHCIETEIKSWHNRLISRYLNLKRPDASLEAEICALENALTHMNFARLRSAFPQLSGNTKEKVSLVVDADHHYRILINDREAGSIKIPPTAV
jgi:hypothetical protein